jgi:CRISPR-associated protein Cas6
MYWQDQEDKKSKYVVPDDIVDLTFKVQCKQLPLDHAHALSQAIQQALPWIAIEPRAGIHLIHGAESGNGWLRPQEPDAMLSLSRRTRFMLRLPKEHVENASNLTDQTLNVAGNELLLREPSQKNLSPLTTIFARYVVVPNMENSIEDEEAFLHQAAGLLKDMDIKVKKMMCGRAHVLRMPEQYLYTRSLMIDGLEVGESVYLQQHGLGEGRIMGCGLFLPHKGIDAVQYEQEK